MNGVEFTENTIATWFVAYGDGSADWQMTVTRKDDGSFDIVYRFRYYKDNKAWDSQDEKNWYRYTAKPGEKQATVMQNCRKVAAEVARVQHGQLWEHVRGRDETLVSFMRRFMKLPFVHARVIEPGTPDWDKYVGKTDGLGPDV